MIVVMCENSYECDIAYHEFMEYLAYMGTSMPICWDDYGRMIQTDDDLFFYFVEKAFINVFDIRERDDFFTLNEIHKMMEDDGFLWFEEVT